MSTQTDSLSDSSDRPTSVRYGVLAWLCAAATIAYLQRNCISVAVGTIQDDLGLTKYQMGLVLSSFYWTYAVFQIPGGWLVKIWGSRFTLPLYSTFWSVSALLTALAGTFFTFWLAQSTGFTGVAIFVAWLWLLFSRLLGGAAQAGIFPSAAVIFSEWLPSNRRAFASGWLAASMQVGALIAFFLTGVFLEMMDWRWVFVVFAFPGFVWSIGFYRWFRDRPQDHCSVNEQEVRLIANSEQQTVATHSDVDPQQAISHEPTPWKRLAASPAMWCICGQQFFRAAGYIFYSTWFPTFLQETRGVSIKESAFLTALPILAALLGALSGGTVSDWVLSRTGNRRLARQGVAVTGLSCCAMCIFIASLVYESIEGPLPAVLLISAGAFCASLAGPASISTTIDMAGKHVATIFATMNMSGNIGAMVFPIVVPILLGETGAAENWNQVLFMFCGIYVAAALCWLFLKPTGTFLDQSRIRES
jgi:MFS family permease